ncbi:hypothetical protein OG349_34465 [Streptomyces sp. NBC_01317]|uniref:hypothetical protein n=1 Tax=Streptomyces sp. NBC_01317 TaxID=2903822 RepID=UPI002E142D99|nr:hypothetical protein OG349_34465 [Streptomyces sp. NBC_01317]
MAMEALSKLMDQISPDHQDWVNSLPRERQLELLKMWENHGGNTELGNIGTDSNSVDPDALIEKFRKN